MAKGNMNRLVPRERLAAIVERVLPEYASTQDDEVFASGNTYHRHTESSVALMAEHIARNTGRGKMATERKLRSIRSGKCGSHKGVPFRGDVSFKVADEILAGLGLTHLWHTELADVYADAA